LFSFSAEYPLDPIRPFLEGDSPVPSLENDTLPSGHSKFLVRILFASPIHPFHPCGGPRKFREKDAPQYRLLMARPFALRFFSLGLLPPAFHLDPGFSGTFFLCDSNCNRSGWTAIECDFHLWFQLAFVVGRFPLCQWFHAGPLFFEVRVPR